jgi:hypothetical protein
MSRDPAFEARKPLAHRPGEGAERQLTNLTPDFDIRDFDISADGREVVFERVQERSDVALLDLPRR